MATNIGALIVELRANSAQFRAEMDGARGALDNTGRSAHGSSQQIARFAAIATEQVIPGAQGMRVALEKVFQQAFTGGGILQTLGKASLVLAAGLGAFKVGSLISEFTALGTTVAKYKENIEKAAEAQAKFLVGIATQSGLLRGLRKDLAAAQGDPLAEIRAAREDREGKIREAFPADSGKRQAALALSAQVGVLQEKKALEEMRKLRDENDQKLLDSIIKQRDEQVKKWSEETKALVDQLKIRSKLRQDFEAQLGQGGLGGTPAGAASGFAAVRNIKDQFTKELRDLAFTEREGLISGLDSELERTAILNQFVTRIDEVRATFKNFPAVISEVDRSLEPLHINFAAIGAEMEKARGFIAAFVPTTQELTGSLGQIAQALATTPPATDAAAKAIQELTLDYHNLQFAIYGATIQLQQYNATAAGG